MLNYSFNIKRLKYTNYVHLQFSSEHPRYSIIAHVLNYRSQNFYASKVQTSSSTYSLYKKNIDKK